jgi:hypothetical protein
MVEAQIHQLLLVIIKSMKKNLKPSSRIVWLESKFISQEVREKDLLES